MVALRDCRQCQEAPRFCEWSHLPYQLALTVQVCIVAEWVIRECYFCSDGETFISADELRINMWNLGHSDTCYNVMDLKPPESDGYVEVRRALVRVLGLVYGALGRAHELQVITCAEFHPSSCNLMIHSNRSHSHLLLTAHLRLKPFRLQLRPNQNERPPPVFTM